MDENGSHDWVDTASGLINVTFAIVGAVMIAITISAMVWWTVS